MWWDIKGVFWFFWKFGVPYLFQARLHINEMLHWVWTGSNNLGWSHITATEKNIYSPTAFLKESRTSAYALTPTTMRPRVHKHLPPHWLCMCVWGGRLLPLSLLNLINICFYPRSLSLSELHHEKWEGAPDAVLCSTLRQSQRHNK